PGGRSGETPLSATRGRRWLRVAIRLRGRCFASGGYCIATRVPTVAAGPDTGSEPDRAGLRMATKVPSNQRLGMESRYPGAAARRAAPMTPVESGELPPNCYAPMWCVQRTRIVRSLALFPAHPVEQ